MNHMSEEAMAERHFGPKNHQALKAMKHEELCSTFHGKACDCGIVSDALELAKQQIEETLSVMDAAVDPGFGELFDALEAIRKVRRSDDERNKGSDVQERTQDASWNPESKGRTTWFVGTLLGLSYS